MRTLFLEIIIALVGLGGAKILLDWYFGERLSEAIRWFASAGILVILVVLAHFTFEPPDPRHLAGWQAAILKKELSQIHDVKLVYIASMPDDREAFDYALELTVPFDDSAIKILIGRPFESGTTVNGRSIPPFPQEVWLNSRA